MAQLQQNYTLNMNKEWLAKESILGFPATSWTIQPLYQRAVYLIRSQAFSRYTKSDFVPGLRPGTVLFNAGCNIQVFSPAHIRLVVSRNGFRKPNTVL